MEFHRAIESEYQKSEWDLIVREYSNLVESYAVRALDVLYEDSNKYRASISVPKLHEPILEVKSPRGEQMQEVGRQLSRNDFTVLRLLGGVFRKDHGITSVALHARLADVRVTWINGQLKDSGYKDICIEAKENGDLVCSGFEKSVGESFKRELFKKRTFTPQEWAVDQNGDAPLATFIMMKYRDLILPQSPK